MYLVYNLFLDHNSAEYQSIVEEMNNSIGEAHAIEKFSVIDIVKVSLFLFYLLFLKD